MCNFVRIPSIYACLARGSFIGEPPNFARTMNVCGTANVSISGGNTKRGPLQLPTWSLNRARDLLVTIYREVSGPVELILRVLSIEECGR